MPKRAPVIREVKGANGKVTHLTQIGNSAPRRRRVPNPILDKAKLAAALYEAAVANQQSGGMAGRETAVDSPYPPLPGEPVPMTGSGGVAGGIFPDVPERPMPGAFANGQASSSYSRLGRPGAPGPQPGPATRRAGRRAKAQFPAAVRT